MSLLGLHIQPPLMTRLDAGDICPIQEGQKNNRSIVPLASNAKAILPEWGFWPLGKVEELSTP